MNIGVTGTAGEKAAIWYLKRAGYRILRRNFSTRYGEIDIVAQDNRYLVFIEVKTRKPDAVVSAAEAVTPAKIGRLRAAAEIFIQENGTSLQPRFDFIGVTARDGRCTVSEHIKNAF